MGKTKIVLQLGLVLLAFLVSRFYYKHLSDISIPDEIKNSDNFWGPKDLQGKKEDERILPFQVNIDDKVLKDLKLKLGQELDSGRLAQPYEGIGFEYGFNTKYLPTVINYWKDKYDWRAREKLLNKYPHFKTKIAGLDIHFQHVKSPNNGKYKKTLPLLLLHGWPGSIVELQKMIPLLSEPSTGDINFELIIPSLPGYGFSQAASRPGLGAVEMSKLFEKLMKRLNFDQYYIHGGDWGSLIVTHMAALFPERVLAVHTNACFSFHPRMFLRLLATTLLPSYFISAEEWDRIPTSSDYFNFIIRETGYLHIQATKPDTVGVALSLSPTGLATYIAEKFSAWTNVAGFDKFDGLLTQKFTMDELLDNIMLYYLSNSITTSMRMYSESFSPRELGLQLDRLPVQVPTGCLLAKNDAYLGSSKWLLEDRLPNIQSYTLAPDGGHFFALEHPDFLARDIIQFITKVESAKK